MNDRGVVDSFLGRARKRHLGQLAVDVLIQAAAAGFAAAVLLLLLGTQILNWWWPVALFVGGLGIAGWRVRTRVAGQYRIAQQIDRALQFKDTVSSAWYFRHKSSSTPHSLAIIERQAAEQIASAELKVAMPYRAPAAIWLATGMALLAGSLFVIRYGMTRTLDLSAPMTAFGFDLFYVPPEAQAATKKSAVQENFEKQLEQFGISLEDLDTSVNNSEATTDQTVGTEGTPDGNVPMQSKVEGDGKEGDEKGEAAGEGADGADKGERAAAADEGGEAPGADPTEGKRQQAGEGNNGQNSGSNGVMDKMRDALANLMAKMRSQSGAEQSQGSQQDGAQQGQQQASNTGGMQGQNKSQADGRQGSDQKTDQAGDAGEKLASGQSKPSDRSSDRDANQDGKSGMGKQDGNKELKEAEQLAAMGKISELIGKRAQQITGEMTVEVPSGKQQLRTAYTDRKALHGDTGAEVHRDEIPLDHQAYVQRYFEEVRKTSGKAAAR